MLVQMFRRINKRAITVDYILIDNWFTSISLDKKLKAINKKRILFYQQTPVFLSLKP